MSRGLFLPPVNLTWRSRAASLLRGLADWVEYGAPKAQPPMSQEEIDQRVDRLISEARRRIRENSSH